MTVPRRLAHEEAPGSRTGVRKDPCEHVEILLHMYSRMRFCVEFTVITTNMHERHIACPGA